MPQQMLQSDTLSLCRPEMPEGVEVITRYQLFKQVISSELDPDAISILAEPIKNPENDTITWYTNFSGPAIHFKEMNEEQKTFVRGEVERRAGQFAELASKYKKSSISNHNMAGELISMILNRIDGYDLYLVGGNPVVVGWGLASSPGRQEKKESPVPPQGSSSKPAGSGSPPPVSPPPGRRPFRLPAWLLPLLGLLLGAVLAAFLLKHLLPDFWSGGFIKPDFNWPSFDSRQNREADLKREQARLKRLYDEKRATCRPSSPASPAFDLPDIKPPDLNLPDIKFPNLNLPNLEIPKLDIQPPDLPDMPEPEKDMVIPEDSEANNDFSFLDGCWASKFKDLLNEKTKQPIIFIYCFDKSGQASVKVEEKDERGRLLDTCRTKATAEFKSGKLIIRQLNPAICNKGGGYSRATAECSQEPGREVECSFRQDGSKLRPKAGFTRILE